MRRYQNGYSQEELANRINIGIAQIKRIETGGVNTSLAQGETALLAQELGVEVGSLFEG